MPLQLETFPALDDNYAFLLHDPKSGATACIDVPDAAPISDMLTARGWTLSDVWLTHHHWDHVDELPNLLAKHPAKVTGHGADAHRLPPLDVQVADGDRFTFGGEEVHVLDVSGHTVGHIAYNLPTSGIAFTADSLMALGCGRLFEGTPAQMFDSLQKLANLPPETIICSGHEYAEANAKFAVTVDPNNPELTSRISQIKSARAAGQPTVPSTLALELATNPYLRVDDAGIRATLDMADATDLAVFTEIRARKDRF